MVKVEVKPLSVNCAWQGARYKTPAYKQYEQGVMLLLPRIKIPQAPYKLTIEFGFGNKASDVDNPCKPFLDILQKKYGINDRDIYELNLRKVIVAKGGEFIKFNIETLVK